MNLRNRRRLQLILIVAVFAVPVIVAAVMIKFGGAPAAHSYGQPLQPERDLAAMPVRAAGKPFALADHAAGVWTLIALPGPDCATHCLSQLDMVHRVQIGLDHDSDKLRLVYLGTPPEGAAASGLGAVWTLATTTAHTLDDLRPRNADSLAAVLVTPSGNAMLVYAPGFTPVGLRTDLRKAVKVPL